MLLCQKVYTLFNTSLIIPWASFIDWTTSVQTYSK